MVSCHQCSTPNSLDSAFCKRCGTALAESDLQDAQEKVSAWISEGNIAFGEGRIEEAIAIADSALESNPRYVEALILKSLCLERLGNISEALVYAEKVVELNPDSELDKIRRNGLRTALGNVLHVPESNQGKWPLVAAAAAVLSVFCLGAWLVHNATAKQEVASLTPQKSDLPITFGTNQNPSPTNPTAPNQNPGASQGQGGGTAPAPSNIPQPTNDQSRNSGDSRPPFESVGPGSLPVQPGGLSGPLTLVPDGSNRPQNPGPSNAGQQQNYVPPAGGDPAPTPEGSGGTPSDNGSIQSPPKPAEDDPGVIEIKVRHSGGRALSGGSQPVGDTGGLGSNGVEALSRTGYQQYMVGSFGAAAVSFEKALRGGGDPIRLNQRLGQVYSKLGRTSDAISAYSRAVAACRQALDSGRGDKTSIQATLDACQQAGKVLGG